MSQVSLDYNVSVVVGVVQIVNATRDPWHTEAVVIVLYYDLTLLPLIICLGRFRIACRYIFNL